MFGTSLKTGINCFCLKKTIIGTATLNFHMMKQEKILKWHSQIVFFSETKQYTYNITVNKYIHNMIRMNGNNNSFKEQHLLVEIPA